jgi:hypothetical protein
VSESFDLSAYRGQTVRLQFGTYNDGVDTQAAQFFDAMSIQACPTPPAPTPTATPTATPAGAHTWLPIIEQDGGGTIPQP